MKKRTTIFIDSGIMKNIKLFAIEHEVSTSQLIEEVMNDFLECALNECDMAISYHYPKGGYND